MNEFSNILDYLLVHDRVYRKWPEPTFIAWVKWYYEKGFIVTCKYSDGDIMGLVMIRPVMEPQDAFDTYNFDYEGRTLYVAELICTASEAMLPLAAQVIKRFGERELVCWQRVPDKKMRVHNTKTLVRNLLRQENLHGAT